MPVGQVASPPSGSGGWDWTPEISPPDADRTVPPETPRPPPLSAPLSAQPTPPAPSPPAPLPPKPLTAQPLPPPSWGSMLGLSEAEAFEAWCTRRTLTLTL